MLGLGLALTSFILVLYRPAIFSYDMLGFELGFCRFGILFSFIIYCLPGFIKEKVHKTAIHKIA
jgi:hypothetical protein